MAGFVSTLTGDTLRKYLAKLRKAREPAPEAKLEQALQALEVVAMRLYSDLNANRRRENETRLMLVEALQLVRKLRGVRLDIEV